MTLPRESGLGLIQPPRSRRASASRSSDRWTAIRRRFLHGWDVVRDGITLYKPSTVAVTRYRYRGRIASPWNPNADTAARLVGESGCGVSWFFLSWIQQALWIES